MAGKKTATPAIGNRQVALGLGAFALGAAAWVIGTGRYGDRLAALLSRLPAAAGGGTDDATQAETDKHFHEGKPNPAAEHVPTDLMADHRPSSTDRAPDAFRPDPTAVPTAEERESLRPATGPAPTLTADRGSGVAEGAGAA